MELIVGFVIAMILLMALAEQETLAEYSDRMAINRLADRSRKRKAPGLRRPCRYAQAGWRPGKHG